MNTSTAVSPRVASGAGHAANVIASQLGVDLLSDLRQFRVLRGELLGTFLGVLYSLVVAFDLERSFRFTMALFGAFAGCLLAPVTLTALLKLRHWRVSEQLCLAPIRPADIVSGYLAYALRWGMPMIFLNLTVVVCVRAVIAEPSSRYAPTLGPILIAGLVAPLSAFWLVLCGAASNFIPRLKGWRWWSLIGWVCTIQLTTMSMLLAFAGVKRLSWFDGAASLPIPSAPVNFVAMATVVAGSTMAVLFFRKRITYEGFLLEKPRINRFQMMGIG